MKNFSTELRHRGLGLGIYISHGNLTCEKFPGSYGFEHIDAQTFADWDVEFVKNDWCSNRRGFPKVPDLDSFQRMRDALNSTGKPMVYAIHWNYWNTKGPGCDGGVSCPVPDLANMWRVGGDIRPGWGSVLGLIDLTAPFAASARPGQWNSLDMMEVGNGMPEQQDRAHFTMWCMLASPLVAGNDVTTMSEVTRKILTNKHAIAVNQDPLGQQATIIDDQSNSTETQVWAKQLASPAGSWAVALLNRGKDAQNITADFTALGSSEFEVLDLWDDAASLGVHKDSITTSVNGTAAAMYKLVPKAASVLLL
jgi:alpha-galactosidase